MFLTNKQAAEQIAGLKARNEELEAEMTSYAGEIESLKTENSNHSAELLSAQEEIKTLTDFKTNADAQITDLESTLAEANTKLSTFDKEVEDKALLKVQSLGFVPKDGQNLESNKDKQDDNFAGLTGLAKATAIHKSQTKTKQ